MTSEDLLYELNQRKLEITERIYQRSLVIARTEQALNAATRDQFLDQGRLSELEELAEKIAGNIKEG